MQTEMQALLSHIEIRSEPNAHGRHATHYVRVLDEDGHVFQERQFENPVDANAWADSWGFPPSHVDGRA